MINDPWYVQWLNSPFFHKLYGKRKEERAGVLMRHLVAHFSTARGSRILDTACGTGDTCASLTELGFDVTGIDLAPASIAAARLKEKENLQFFIHDIRLPFFTNYFDLAFNIMTSFGYFRTRREHEAAIRTIARSLKPGGKFVIDYPNTHFAEDHLRQSEIIHEEGTKYEFLRWQNETHFFSRLRITDESLKAPMEITEEIVKFNLGDFNDMFSFHGMQVQEVFGDYDLGHYDTRLKPRLLIVAEKKKDLAGDKMKRIYSDGRKTDALT